MDNEEFARKATTLAYANRIIGNKLTLPKVRYTGTFDYKDLADSVPIPKSPQLLDHQQCWTKLFQAFYRAWWEQEQ